MIRQGYIILAIFVCLISSSSLIKSASAEFKIGGELRGRLEFSDNMDFNADHTDNNTTIGQRLRFNLMGRNDNFTGFVQIQDVKEWGRPNVDLFAGFGQLSILQGYFDINWNTIGRMFILRTGRQELKYGEERLIGDRNWSNQAQSFDAIKFLYSSDKHAYSIDGWWAKLNEIGTNFGNDRERSFYGIYIKTKRLLIDHEWDFYWLYYTRDAENNSFPEIDGKLVESSFNPTKNMRIHTYGTRIKGKWRIIDYTSEFMVQSGLYYADPMSAWAFHVRGGVFLPIVLSPYLGAEYDFASGDKDASDGRRHTFFNLFPTNHYHYGFMDLFALMNLKDYRFFLSFKPTERFGLEIDYHIFQLADQKDAWYNSEGKIIVAANKNNNVGDVGKEVDIVASSTIFDVLKLYLGFSYFMGGDYVNDAVSINSISKNKGIMDNAYFGYLQLQYNF